MAFLSFLQPNLRTVDEKGDARSVRGDRTFAPDIMLIARKDCQFARIRLPVANKAGLQAARMQARQGQRFNSLRTRIDQDRDDPRNAGLWTWNDTNPKKHDPKQMQRVLPETLARMPIENGTRLVKCLYGVEGEVWQNEQLVASRWWPTKPDTRDWQLFLRAAKVQTANGTVAIPEPELVHWRTDLPIIDQDPDNLVATFAPPKVAIAAAALLLFLAALQVSQLLVHRTQTNNAHAKLELATRTNQDAFRARASALSTKALVAEKAAIENPALIVQILDTLTQTITEDIGDIVVIRISDDTLECQIRIDQPTDGTSLAQSLERSPFLTSVFIENTNPQTIVVKATIPADTPMPAPELPEQTPDTNHEENTAPDGTTQTPTEQSATQLPSEEK